MKLMRDSSFLRCCNTGHDPSINRRIRREIESHDPFKVIVDENLLTGNSPIQTALVICLFVVATRACLACSASASLPRHRFREAAPKS
jgi:hypothetical protein